MNILILKQRDSLKLFKLTGLLTREERLLNKVRFNMNDLSDRSHDISAFLNKFDPIMIYDEHFHKIKDVIPVYTPQKVVAKFL